MEYYKKLRVFFFFLQLEMSFTVPENSTISENHLYYLPENKNVLGMTFCNPMFELNRGTSCEQTGEMYEINIFLLTITAFEKAFEAIGMFNKKGIKVSTEWAE